MGSKRIELTDSEVQVVFQSLYIAARYDPSYDAAYKIFSRRLKEAEEVKVASEDPLRRKHTEVLLDC